MVRKPGGSQPATRRNETSCTHHAERKDRNRPVTTQNPGTLFTDGNGCVRRARRPVSCNGGRTGGGQAGTSGWYRLLPPYPDLHGRNKRRYKTEEYESKAERHQIPGGSGTEK